MTNSKINNPIKINQSRHSFLNLATTTLFIWVFVFLSVSQVSAKTLLPPDQAYQFEASMISNDTALIEWRIAKGYYLYKKKFKFSISQVGINIGSLSFPKGSFVEDEFFGKSEIYRDSLSLNLPIVFDTGNKIPDVIDLEVTSQGCADIGVCFPPQKQTVRLNIEQNNSLENKTGGLFDSISTLTSKLGFGQQSNTFLKPEEAFIFSADVESSDLVIAKWKIEPGYFLYREQFKFKILDNDSASIKKVTSPDGVLKHDELFGKVEVYFDQALLKLKLKKLTDRTVPILLEASYQGCAENGFCYPPMKQTMNLTLPAGKTSETSASIETSTPISEQDKIAQSLTGQNIGLTIFGFLIAGLLLSFTPCVLPMVPILSSIIVGQNEPVSTRKAFFLSLAYVMAMVMTYTLAGVFAGLFGQNLQIVFQTPWVIAAFSLLFVLLALSMFGFYELQLPSALQTRLNNLSNHQKRGTYVGAGVMGFLSALIVGPCIAAPLAGILIYIGMTGDGFIGGISLFMLSLGMGIPLLIFGTSAGKWLPKAGKWMDQIKGFFGVLLLGLAIWMLERIIPPHVTMLMWGALLIGTSVYVGAFDRLQVEASNWRKFFKVSGIILLIYGVLILVGAASGGYDVFQPLKGSHLLSNKSETGQPLKFTPIKGLSGLDSALKQAKRNDQWTMLDFYADWCIDCKIMEKRTFSDTKIKNALTKFHVLQADVTANDEKDKKLLKQFNLFGPPAILFFNKNGDELSGFRVVGYKSIDEFLEIISTVKNFNSTKGLEI